MADSEKLFVRFWEDAWENPAKSAEAGRKVFDTVPWVEIKVPGEQDTMRGPVHLIAKQGPEKDPRLRFPSAWAAFQRDSSTEGIVGTPLTEVPWLGKGEVETLRYAGIRTLENLAGVNDSAVSGLPGGIAMRQKAQAMLTAAKDSAPLQKMSEELAKRDQEIASLKAQIADIVAASAKRGRKE